LQQQGEVSTHNATGGKRTAFVPKAGKWDTHRQDNAERSSSRYAESSQSSRKSEGRQRGSRGGGSKRQRRPEELGDDGAHEDLPDSSVRPDVHRQLQEESASSAARPKTAGELAAEGIGRSAKSDPSPYAHVLPARIVAAAVTVFTGAIFSSVGWTAHDRTIDMVNDGFDGVIRISGVATNATVDMIETLGQTGNQGIHVVAGLVVTVILVKFRAYHATLTAPEDYSAWDLVLDTSGSPPLMLEASPSDDASI